MKQKRLARLLLIASGVYIAAFLFFAIASVADSDIPASPISHYVSQAVYYIAIPAAIYILKLMRQTGKTRSLYNWLLFSVLIGFVIDYLPNYLFIFFRFTVQSAVKNENLSYLIYLLWDYIGMVLPIPFLIAILIEEGSKNNTMILMHFISYTAMLVMFVFERMIILRQLDVHGSRVFHGVYSITGGTLIILWALGAVNMALKALKRTGKERETAE